MKLRAERSFIFFLILSSLLVDVSESTYITPVIGFINRGKQIPMFLRNIFANKWISNFWNKLKSIFKGLKIGQTVEGVSQVKEYYDIFGYVNSSLHSNFTDEFTPDLQSAVIEFQKNYNLEVTGQLDQEIYQIIAQPRCGVPDIVNGTTTMNSGNMNTTSFKPWWKIGEKELTYAFNPQNNITENVRVLFKDAFKRWAKVTSLNFKETTSFNASDIKIAFVTFDGKDGTVGAADRNYSMHVGYIFLDSEEQWVLSNENVIKEGGVDMESVVMHQVGHILGLGHSSTEEAVMYPIVLVEKKTELADDDLKRIQQIYGVNSNNNGSALSHGKASSGTVVGCEWQRHLVLTFIGGFMFMVFGFF